MLRLIQCSIEFQEASDIKLGKSRRGIYVLYKNKEVVYVGMTTTDIAKRLHSHRRSERKRKLWSHYSAYAVWPNITNDEIRELEALFRHIYRYSSKANILNIQRGSTALRKVRVREFKDWIICTTLNKNIGRRKRVN